MFRRLRFGEKLAAVSALALFGFLFLDWFGSTRLEGIYISRGALGTSTARGFAAHQLSGWHALGWLSLGLVLLTILAGLALPLVVGSHESPVLPVLAAITTTTLGLLSLIALAVQGVLQPGDNATTVVLSGYWLGLIATAGVARGGFLSMRQEYLPAITPAEVEVRPAPPAVPAA